MKIVALIPARLESTRLPNKLLQNIGVDSVLTSTYKNALATNLFDDVICISNNELLDQEILNINGKVLRSTMQHETGTDRIAEFASEIDADIIINIQADEPFINKELLQNLVTAFEDKTVEVATLMFKINNEDAQNPNFVKVIADENNFAIYFSRHPIPFNRTNANIQYYKHIGIYAFRKNALIKFASLPQPDIEKAESLENLRFIYYKIPVKLIETNFTPIGIDTIEDLEKARMIMIPY
jgi:3-deoxy-manno-octulosonate cytidylyltransferase (CMP-KDO synthetase)